MKRTTIIFLLMILSIGLLAWRNYTNNSTPCPVFDLVQRTEIEILPAEVHPILKAVNKKNEKITSFICTDIDVRIKRNGSNHKLDGLMLHEKDRNFRLKVSSFFGTELDMGSNNKQFWVWSRRVDPKATMFFADHDNLYKTRLRTPFVPLWIMSALGYRVIDPDEVSYKETEDHLILSRIVISPTGQPLIKRAYIDKKTCQIVAYYLYDSDGVEVTVTQIGYSEDGMPRKIYMRWNEEDVIMDFIFHNPKVNEDINSSNFELPDYKNKIEMGKDDLPSPARH
jgi:outer membrane lipoprotein-sorting protein